MEPKILDFYIDPSGRKWTPDSFTESHVYMRSDFYGHLSFAVFKINNGEVNFPRPVKTFPNGSQAISWIRDHGEGLPKLFISSEVKRRLAEARGEL